MSLAMAWAESIDCTNIFIGVNAVDYSGYPDCREEYIKSFQNMANLATKKAVEGDLGRIIILHAPRSPLTPCGILNAFVIGIFIKFFLPSVFAFLKALTTSSALPTPTPTWPFSSPITTTARKLNFFPPFVTFVTRPILINRSINFSSFEFPLRRDVFF